MAKNITIKVPGKHPQTGELTTFELRAFPHSREGHRNFAHAHPEWLSHRTAWWLAHRALRNT